MMYPAFKTPYEYDNLNIGNMYNLLLYNPEVYTYTKGHYTYVYVEWNIDGQCYCMDRRVEYLRCNREVRRFVKYCNRVIVRVAPSTKCMI